MKTQGHDRTDHHDQQEDHVRRLVARSAGRLVSRSSRRPTGARTVARIVLGVMLMFAGTSHLSFARKPFQAQVPESIPLDPDTTVLASGVVEISLGAAIAFAPRRYRRLVGDVAAVFFTAILPGNVAQLVHHRDAFGLDTDRKRALRLLGQPLLVAWALWSTHD